MVKTQKQNNNTKIIVSCDDPEKLMLEYQVITESVVMALKLKNIRRKEIVDFLRMSAIEALDSCYGE